MNSTLLIMSDAQQIRIDKVLRRCIAEFGLDLQRLTIFTEAATSYYLYTPILAALAGARKVYAVTADSGFGTKENVKKRTLEAALRWSVADKIEILFSKEKRYVSESDIITNTGFVRPIDREMVSWMKPTAVIPLMWESWEFRDADLDLQACREHEILVMGTDESKPPLSMPPYSGYLAMKLLFESGLEGFKTKTLLLGGGTGLGRSIYSHFKQLGMEITWFADSEEESLPYKRLRAHFSQKGSDYDLLILAEHLNNVPLLGKDGLLTYQQISQVNPALRIGIISGDLDIEGMKNSGLHFFPQDIQPFGYMSYQPYHLGPLPVLELYAAGLKVGEMMARARLRGMEVEEAKGIALRNSPAMDFP